MEVLLTLTHFPAFKCVLSKVSPQGISHLYFNDAGMPQERFNHEESTSLLKKLRIQAGLTQAELARQIPDKTGTKPISQRAVSAWERGEYQPELTIPQMKALCKALNVSLDELPNDCGPPKLQSHKQHD